MAIAWTTNVATSGGSTTAATSGTCTSLVVTKGDLILVFIGTIATTITSVTDTANNKYSPASAFVNTGTVSGQLWKAWALTTTTIATITANFGSSRWGMIATGYSGVPQTKDFSGTATGSSATPSLTDTLEDANNWVVTGLCVRGSTTITANTGNLRTSRAGGGTTSPGIAIVDNTAASGSVVTSITITSASWGATGEQFATVPAQDFIQAGFQNDTLQEINPVSILDY